MTALQLSSGERNRGLEVTRVFVQQWSKEPKSDLLQRTREPRLWACCVERAGEVRGAAVEERLTE